MFYIPFCRKLRAKQTLYGNKTWILCLGLGLNSNPKTQKNQTQTQKCLGFKNILFILKYSNEYIF